MTEKSRMDKAFDKRDIFIVMEPEDVNKYLISNYRYYPATNVEFDDIGYFKLMIFGENKDAGDLIDAFDDSIKFGKGFDINIKMLICVEVDLYELNKDLIDAFVEDHNIPSPYFIEHRGKPQKKWDHRKTLTPDEMEAMFNSCKDKRDTFMITTLFHTGMRVNEFRAMRSHWIRIKDGVMVVSIPREETKTAAGERTIFVTDQEAISIICDWFEYNESYGRSDVTAWKRCIAIAKKAGITHRVTPHILRHTAISKWAWDGKIPEELIRKMAGHTDINFTAQTYIHLIKGEIPTPILELVKS